MYNKPTAVPSPVGTPDPQPDPAPAWFRRVWHGVRGRILGGVLVVLPILITLWIIHWLYSTLEKYVIDPLALLVLWQVNGRRPDTEPAIWFETYAAPVIAILIALALLYCCGLFVRSRLRQVIDWILLRLPVVSVVYNGVRNVFQALDRQGEQQHLQRAVLVAFPHPGMKTPAFVTATCRDIETQKVLLCVFVPTAPMPVSGFLLLVPEEEVTELNWSPEQTLQTLISVGLTIPPEIHYFKNRPDTEITHIGEYRAL
ncbi:MAG: DUF502 domain-containing protein [Planctomycetota bacterium]